MQRGFGKTIWLTYNLKCINVIACGNVTGALSFVTVCYKVGQFFDSLSLLKKWKQFFLILFFFAWFFVHDFIHVQERTLLEKLLLRKYYLIIVLSFLCFLYAFSHFLVSSFVALSAIIFGSLTWRCEKPLLILSTSFLGSFLVICGM